MSNFDDRTRELRELIALMEADHRKRMRPFYEQLIRHESMRLPVVEVCAGQFVEALVAGTAVSRDGELIPLREVFKT